METTASGVVSGVGSGVADGLATGPVIPKFELGDGFEPVV
jgi:hypothetical protein